MLESQKAYTIQHPYGSLTETQPLKEISSGRTPDTAKHKHPRKLETSQHVNIFHDNAFSYI